jgi:hypothetical protein
MAEKFELKVFIASGEARCDECNSALVKNSLYTSLESKGAVCLACADLDHLIFLPAGDSALTRRSTKHSRLCAVVYKWRKSRRRFERQGVLVEEEALSRAERECEADQGVREAQQTRAAVRRNELDKLFVADFSKRLRELFPSMPMGREELIAEHACRKHSRRVGRSAAAKSFDTAALHLAVIAHIRHAETPYDELLMRGSPKREARCMIQAAIDETFFRWQSIQQTKRLETGVENELSH